jgi:hypothetical protein
VQVGTVVDHLPDEKTRIEHIDSAGELARLEVFERQSQLRIQRLRDEFERERENNWVLAGLIVVILGFTAIAVAVLHDWR